MRPHISLTKTAAEANYDAAGDVIHYTLVAINDGNVSLSGVTITDPQLGTLDFDPASPATLAPGETMTATGSYTVSQADLDAGHCPNLATASGVGPAPGNMPVSASAYLNVPGVWNLHLALTKTADEANYDAVGDIIHYMLVATNAGNLTLHNVTIADPKLDTLSFDPAAPAILAPGETLTATGTHTVTQADLDAGRYYNLATATANGPAPSNIAIGVRADENIPAAQRCALSIDKKTNGLDYGGSILIGETVHWTYLVTNTGNVTLTDIVVTDSKGIAVSAPKTSLVPGESMTATASGTAIVGNYANTATASGKGPQKQAVSTSDTSGYFGADPQIAINKQTLAMDGTTWGDGVFVLAGTTVTWRYRVTNAGNVPLGNISVTDDKTGVTPVYDSGDTNGDGILDLTETWTYLASGIAVGGRYSNLGETSGSFTDTAGHTRTDKAADASGYIGKIKVRVSKTVNGLPFSGPALTFELRQGAAPVAGQFGTVLQSKVASVGNNGQITFDVLLLPGLYQLCEYVPEGYVPSYIWGTYGVDWFKPGYAPGEGGLNPNILVAVNFIVNTDGTINFQNGQQIVPVGGSININNQVGQMPRTLGYWKNHASASGSNGGQEPVLDRMLLEATLAGYSIRIGTVVLPGNISNPDNAGIAATQAVRLLNKSTITTNRKMASDPCFNLAAQLLAYRLNQPFGAFPNSIAAAAADYAQAMLLAENFNGVTHDRLGSQAIANLNYLACVLDAYNNNTIVITSLALPYPDVYR